MPTSRRLDTLPYRSMRPSVGSVMRLRIFSNVDLPAPFFPIKPTTSDSPIVKPTSLSAQSTSFWALASRRRNGALRISASCSRRTRYAVASPRRYIFPTPCATMRSAMSDDVREDPLGLFEVDDAGDEEHDGDDAAGQIGRAQL